MADPYRNYKWRVEVDGFTRAGFSKVSGLGVEVEDIEYREGDQAEFMSHYSGQVSFPDITLERGMSNDSDFLEKLNQVFNAADGVSQGDNDMTRFNCSIYLRGKDGADKFQWKVDGNWAKALEFDDLDATANDILLNRIIIRPQSVQFINLS